MNNETALNSLKTADALDRAENLCNEDRMRNYLRTDKMFAVLMPIQWVVAIIFALVVAPQVWAGTDWTPTNHLYVAIFVGGA